MSNKLSERREIELRLTLTALCFVDPLLAKFYALLLSFERKNVAAVPHRLLRFEIKMGNRMVRRLKLMLENLLLIERDYIAGRGQTHALKLLPIGHSHVRSLVLRMLDGEDPGKVIAEMK